jgi:uncharacterized protein YjaG (DUF416 family)
MAAKLGTCSPTDFRLFQITLLTKTTVDHFLAEASLRVPALTTAGKLVFAYAICVRLQPHYQAFFEAEGWGNPIVLQTALDLLRQAVLLSPAVADLQKSYQQVENVTPDSDDFGGTLGSFALDTCCAILSALDFVLVGTDQYVLDVATFARNTVDLYVQELEDMEPSDPELEQKIDCNQYMVREVSWQREALNQLVGIAQPTPLLLDRLLQGRMLDLELLPEG